MEKTASQRILALDLLRGYFLCVILVDHLYRFPGFFDIFSGQGKLWVSAAEGFFLISGALVGLIYKKPIDTALKTTVIKLWRRAATLYLASIILTILFTVWANITPSVFIKQGWLPLSDTLRLITQTLTLQYTYGWADFLSYYAVFMLFAPLALFLMAKKKWWLVLLSTLIIWGLRQSNFYLAWQLLFFAGMIIGYYLTPLEDWFRSLSSATKKRISTSFIVLTLSTLCLSFVFVFGIKNTLDLDYHFSFLPDSIKTSLLGIRSWHSQLLITIFDKGMLGPGRAMLSLLWFSCLYGVVRSNELKIDLVSKGFFKILGANSLLAYSLHAILLFPINLILPYYTNVWQNIGINALLLTLLFALVVVIKKVQVKASYLLAK